MHKGVVEGCKDVADAKDVLAIPDLRAEGDVFSDGRFDGWKETRGYQYS